MRSALCGKLLMGAAVAALSLGTTQAMASGGAETNWATVDNHGFLGLDLMLEGGYTFGTSGIAYGQLNDGATLNSPFKVDMGDGFTGKLGIAGRFEGGWTFGVKYTGIRTTNTADSGLWNLSNSANPHPLYTILGPDGTSYSQIISSTSTKVDMIDLTAGYDVGLGGEQKLTLTGGLRYGLFNQNTNTIGYYNPANFWSDSMNSTYRGFGPVFGASYSVPVTNNGFSLFGSATGSLLYGTLKTSRVNAYSGNSSSTSDHHFAYTAETQAGVSYKLPQSPATISVGYQLSYFDKVRNSASGSSVAINPGVYGKTADSMLYNGPFARLVISLP